MNFNTKVDVEVVDAILESSLWKKAKINVQPRKIEESSENEGPIGNIAEYEDGVVNEFEEPTDLEAYDGEAVEQEKFSLDDLQFVLDNLEDEDLMEHAKTMLDVFDSAYEQLSEEEYDEEDEEDEALDEGKPARGMPKKRGQGTGPGGGRKQRGTGKVPFKSNMRRSDQKKSTVFPDALDDGEQ